MNDKKNSKAISYYLRHHPEKAGLKLDNEGYVDIESLLEFMKISREDLDRIMENNDKQRFSYDQSKTKIRDNQGHSVSVNLGLKSSIPPLLLYHGTSKSSLERIKKEGLQKMSRQHVHLSTSKEVAMSVGLRHAKSQNQVVILEIDTTRMLVDKYQFYLSDNGVWLTDNVPPQYLIQVPI